MIQHERPHDEPSTAPTAQPHVASDATGIEMSRARLRPGDTLPETPAARRERARESISNANDRTTLDKACST